MRSLPVRLRSVLLSVFSVSSPLRVAVRGSFESVSLALAARHEAGGHGAQRALACSPRWVWPCRALLGALLQNFANHAK